MHTLLEFRGWSIGDGSRCTKTRHLHLPSSDVHILMHLRSLEGDVYAMRTLREHLWLRGEPVHRFNDDQVLDRILYLLRSGDLHICGQYLPDFVAGGGSSGTTQSKTVAEPPPPENEPAKEPAKSQEEKTWIEIELVDDQGQPVPGEKYRILLTDGSTREGALDSQGRVRFDPIDFGVCDVSLPNRDAGEWKAA